MHDDSFANGTAVDSGAEDGTGSAVVQASGDKVTKCKPRFHFFKKGHCGANCLILCEMWEILRGQAFATKNKDGFWLAYSFQVPYLVKENYSLA